MGRAWGAALTRSGSRTSRKSGIRTGSRANDGGDPVGHSPPARNARPSSAAATGIRRSSNVRGDRDGQSRPFSWVGREGWAQPKKWGAAWHLWRHGHTVCGAYRWEQHWGTPDLKDEVPKPDYMRRRGDVCQRCEKRAGSRRRRLSRDLGIRR